MTTFNNTYARLPERFYQKTLPAQFEQPSLIAFNNGLAKELGISLESSEEEEIAQIFSGQKLIEGSEPIAMAYAGMQFGHPVPQLGDGRAHLLGEVSGFDVQLKGSGQTRFSRGGDGRSALGPVLREYIVSEAMNSLGVPTTRALCAVRTGEEVYRQSGPEPGGIFTRVAESHIRVGTFQYFAFRNDLEAIETLLEYTINRHYPELAKLSSIKERSLEFLKALALRQADLIGKWSALGFIHGVMNTDNFSVAGITIDYGPCAFMDEFQFNKVFSSIDSNGRYSFFNQVPIGQWNILRLAECLLPLIGDDQTQAVEIIERELGPLLDQFPQKRLDYLAKKLGIEDFDDQDKQIVMGFLQYLEKESLDFTSSFRNLPKLFAGDFTGYPKTEELEGFLNTWKSRVDRVDHLDHINPLYIPRNHQIERAIKMSYQNDDGHFDRLNQVLSDPFNYQEGFDEFIDPPREEERVHATFCGT